jgi:histidinol phosphatase-like enzyme (inositol monophosphatase family)
MALVPPDYVDFAHRLADASGAVIRRYFRTPVQVDDKPDETPVTIADREAESIMRGMIAKSFPSHGIIGEEEAPVRPDADWVWTLDPVDGTKAFISGKPLFGTLIGLGHCGRPQLGVIDQPVLRERWLGVAGEATTFNGARIATRRCPSLKAATLNATAPDMFAGADETRFVRLKNAVKLAMYGGDCYAYGLLASGFIDLVAEAGLKIFDYFPLVPVIEGAGGTITDWDGKALGLASGSRVVAAGDAAAHAAALKMLSSPA